MRKASFSLAIFFFISLTGLVNYSSAQTLLTYGDNSISKEEFLRAYKKNNIASKPTEKSYRNYLELYTRFKLKVRAAYDLKLQELPNQVS